MSNEEFWHGNVKLAKAYREAAKINRENRYFAEWRIGLYVTEALLTASPAFRELSPGIKHEYPTRPFFVEGTQVKSDKKDANLELMEKNKAVFIQMANRINESLQTKVN